MKTRKLNIFAMALVLLCALVLPTAAHAAEAIDTEQSVSTAVHYRYDGKAIEGARFDLYRVAAVSSTGKYTLTGSFKGYPVAVNNLGSAMADTAQTLASLIARDGIAPDQSGVTDANGVIVFPTAGTLKPGMYLIIGNPCTTSGYTYSCEPFLLALPGLVDGQWCYEGAIYPKPAATPEESTENLNVIKIWGDKGAERQRPKEVTIYLYRDGRLFDSTVLSSKNNWRYSWRDLPTGSRWTIAEKKLDKYIVSISRDGATVTVTNTYTKSPEYDPELPYTGVLWWPVTAMATAGLALFTTGYAISRRRDDE